MLVVTEGVTINRLTSMSPMSLGLRIGGPFAGAALGYHLGGNHPYPAMSYGMVNASNVGDYVADMIDKRDSTAAAKDLAYKTAAGNTITSAMLHNDLRYAGPAGVLIPNLIGPNFDPQPEEAKKSKK